jgi:type II secretory pathway component PulL
MHPYKITVIDRRRKRHSYVALAACWLEAWRNAANEFGIAALVVVKPA